ncbi:MAG: PAS domain S-box protein [bacterium]|nr:PAS domain S-box protein [bacterium]
MISRRFRIFVSRFRIVLCGTAAAGLFWVLDSVVDFWFFNDGGLSRHVFGPEPHDIWMRCFTTAAIISPTWLLQGMLNRRRRTEKELRKSEARFRLLYEDAPLAYQSLDEDGNIIEVNRAWLTMLGFTRERILGRPMRDFLVADSQAQFEKHFAFFKQTAAVTNVELSLLAADGRTVIAAVNGSISKGEDGKFLRTHCILEDIGQRKESEQALRASELRFRELYDNMHDGSLATDWNGRILHCNRAYMEMLGYSLEELQSMTYRQITPGRWHAAEQRIVDDELYSRGYTRAYEKEYIRKDGSLLPVELTAYLVHGGDGRATSTWAIVRDITKRKEAERAIRQSEKQYRSIFDSVTDSLLVMNSDGEIVEANEAACQLYRYPRRELIGLSGSDLAHKDYCHLGPKLNETVREKGRFSAHSVDVRKDGSSFDIEVRATAVDFEGQPHMLVVGRDISERKRSEEAIRQSEEKYRELAERAPEGIFEADLDGKLIYANNQARKYTGHTEEDIARGVYLRDIVAEEEVQRLAAERVDVARGQSLGVREYLMNRKDGTRMSVAVNSTPLMKDGKVVGTRGVVVDISAYKKAELDNLKRQSLESIGVLAGGIAHDFNNFLAGILGNLSLVRLDLDSEDENVALLREAELAAERARGLTQQLLTFSRGGAPVRKAVSIAELVKDSASFALRGSSVRADFQGADLSCRVNADAGQIGQVVHNIALNAVQAMPEGGTLSFSIDTLDGFSESGERTDSPEQVRVTIRDEGCGISARVLSRIFDPYFTTRDEGTGLGLAISYSIVKKHGGRLEVESEEGRGTSFHIYLPLLEGEPASAVVVAGEPVAGQGRILVMDDESYVRDLIKNILQRAGYSVARTRDVASCLDRFKFAMDEDRPFDAVILDLTIPGGMGGKEAISKLRQIDPRLKALVCSGYSNDPVMANAPEYGFDGVVTKPFRPQDLCVAVDRVIRRPIASDHTPT